jgi:two-component system, cell cycle response regulator DivK
MKALPQGDEGPRPLVLVVDDYTDGRDIVCCVLANEGLSTIEATNGHDALAQVREHLPDVVVLDLALPGIDGWEVARMIKADSATADVRLLGFTAHAEKAALLRAREAGCDAVLTKPCAPKVLVQGVRDLLAAREREQPMHRKAVVRRRRNG